MDAVDFVSAPDPALLKSLGLGALPYTGNARPSQDWFDQIRGLGVPIPWMIQETYSTRSQEGHAAGVSDAQYAESRAREVGHVGPIAYVLSDGNGADAWDTSDYRAGVESVATLPIGAWYGSLGVGATWVPETWGAGTVASQVVGLSPVGDTDLNHIYIDEPATPPPSKGRSVIYREDKADGTHDYCIPGAADMVSVPEAVGVGHAINGDIVVPIKTPERIAMGVNLKKSFQAASGTAPAVDLSGVKAAAKALLDELAKTG